MTFTLKSWILVTLSLLLSVTAESYVGKATYHTDWPTTACGEGPWDGAKFVTALNPSQYGDGLGNNSPVCGNTITVTFGGKSAVVTVIDMGGVGPGGLDLSIAAFEHFKPLCVGFFYPTWTWNDYVPGTGAQNKPGLEAVRATSNVTVAYTVPQACDATGVSTGVASSQPAPSVGTIGGLVAPSVPAESPAVAPTSPVAISSATVPLVPAVSSAVPAVPSVATSAVPTVPIVATSAVPVAPVSAATSALPVAPVVSSVAPVAPVASSVAAAPVVSASTPAVVPVVTSARTRPTGHGGHRGSGRQRRCAAQL